MRSVRERKEMAVVVIGTCLNVDDRAAVRVVVEDYSVKFECAGTEIEMDPDSLTMFIAAGEEGLTKLTQPSQPVNGSGAKRVDVAASEQPSAVDADDEIFRTSASTWVVCDTSDWISHTTVGGRVELNWSGRLVWTISTGALSRLLDRARRAQPVLDERMNTVGRLPDDQEIPEIDCVAVTELVRAGGRARAGVDN